MMLMQPAPQGQSISRPFLAGILMLMLFFSLSTDWSSGNKSGRRAELRQLGFPQSPVGSKFPLIHEKLIHELSVTNDKLEKENWKLKQHLLDLKRTIRKHKIDLNSTLLTYPEVESWIQEDSIKEPKPGDSAEESGVQKNHTAGSAKEKSKSQQRESRHAQRLQREQSETDSGSS